MIRNAFQYKRGRFGGVGVGGQLHKLYNVSLCISIPAYMLKSIFVNSRKTSVD